MGSSPGLGNWSQSPQFHTCPFLSHRIVVGCRRVFFFFNRHGKFCLSHPPGLWVNGKFWVPQLQPKMLLQSPFALIMVFSFIFNWYRHNHFSYMLSLIWQQLFFLTLSAMTTFRFCNVCKIKCVPCIFLSVFAFSENVHSTWYALQQSSSC